MSKGGGSQTVTQEIDPDVKAAYLTNLDYARDVSNQMGARQFAGFNPQYQAGEQQIQAAAQGGTGMQNLDTAADLTRAGAGYSPMAVGGISAGPAAMAGSTGYNAAQFVGVSAGPASLAGSTGYNAAQFGGAQSGPAAMGQAAQADMSGIGQYMNPYTSQVIDATMSDLEKARQKASQQIGQQANAARAFGGSRQGVAEAMSNAQFGEQAGKTISQLRAQGFDTAANLMQQDVARQQQSGLSNQAALNQMSQFNTGNLQQAGLSNQAALNQAGQFGAGAANQAALANQGALNQMAQYNAGNFQQAGLSNQGAINTASQFGAGAANQAALSNQAAMNQMNQYNAGLGQQAQLANQSADLQGAQFRLGAANQLGTMGQQQTAQQYAAGQALMGLGGQRQAAAQQQLDAQRNLNLERLGIMQGALGLNPANLGGSSTQPMYQNTGANIMGGALGGASLAPLLSMGAGTGAGIGALLGLI